MFLLTDGVISQMRMDNRQRQIALAVHCSHGCLYFKRNNSMLWITSEIQTDHNMELFSELCCRIDGVYVQGGLIEISCKRFEMAKRY